LTAVPPTDNLSVVLRRRLCLPAYCLTQCQWLQIKLYIDKKVLKDDATESSPVGGKKKNKKKGSFKESLATLKESPKIMNLALLVVCYALAHRLFEFAWKGQLRVLFPTTQAYSGALADVSILTGAIVV
jgi:ATP/ADP translocase